MNTITTEEIDTLNASAVAAKVEAEKAKTIHANTKAHLDRLTVELAALPSEKMAAIMAGDIDGYTRVIQRETVIPAEVTIGQIAAAKAQVAYLKAEVEWANANRAWASLNSQYQGKNSGFRNGMAEGHKADNLYEGARGTRASLSAMLGEAHRNLDALIQQAMATRSR